MARFRVDSIDHVELFVPDRRAAAEWYSRALGLEICSDFEFWADDAGGPLMIATADGRTKLALFTGTPCDSQSDSAGFRRVAFRVDGDGFVAFVQSAGERGLRDADGGALSALKVVDHQSALSVYFRDPWGHALEVTTYDAASARSAL